tara:strand:- start:462 stop:1601 length:1140 start_codon:yes stop_codon:yes gene_type:complete
MGNTNPFDIPDTQTPISEPRQQVNRYTVTYEVDGPDIPKIAHEIAIGQSIGNPNIRSEIENSQNIKDFAANIVSYEDNIVKISFNRNAFIWPNINQLMCIIMGGHTDIMGVDKCRVIDIDIDVKNLKPVLGMSGWKKRLDAENRPLFGAIIKPKSGLTEEQYIRIVKDMIYGGADFIKEDEIMADNLYLPLTKRVETVEHIKNISGWKGYFAYCINADPMELVSNLKAIYYHTCTPNIIGGCHINFWSSLGAYTTARGFDIATHYQRSGIRILTDPSNKYSVAWPVLVKLACLAGVDSIHVGMLGGYYPEGETEEETLEAIDICKKYDVIPSLSCGMNPVLAREIRERIGNDFMASVGGWLHTGDSLIKKVMEMKESLL